MLDFGCFPSSIPVAFFAIEDGSTVLGDDPSHYSDGNWRLPVVKL
jgi:hypothetical protein